MIPCRYKPIHVENTYHLDLDEHQRKYNLLRDSIYRQRKVFRADFHQNTNNNQKVLAEAGYYLADKLPNRLFPFWYGTSWDFNGTSECPLTGNIACGYFVSTTLKHAGFAVQKVKLAQQPASNIIKTVCQKGSIRVFHGNKHRQFLNYLKTQPDGLYILGLDYHVGWVHKFGSDINFIHSLCPSGVVRENASKSSVIQLSNVHYVGCFTCNSKVIEKWVLRNPIPTVGGN